MGQSKQTRLGDYVAPPTIGSDNRVRTISVSGTANATDTSTPVDCAGRYVSIYNAGTATAYVAFDSTNGGTAVTTTTGMPIAPGCQRDVLLAPFNPSAATPRPHKYLKAIGDGTTTLYFYVSTNYVEGV